MNVVFRRSFAQDLRQIREKRLLARITQAIEAVEAAENISQVPNVRKMSGPGNFYRIRIGDHRVGVSLAGNEVEFVRCLNRREIYRFFP